jgi:hypothetical protein
MTVDNTDSKVARGMRKRLASLTQQEAKIHEKIKLLQAECPHITLTMRYGGDTGNFDPANDSYWVDWACQDCGKRWSTSQDREEIQKYPHAINITRR